MKRSSEWKIHGKRDAREDIFWIPGFRYLSSSPARTNCAARSGPSRRFASFCATKRNGDAHPAGWTVNKFKLALRVPPGGSAVGIRPHRAAKRAALRDLVAILKPLMAFHGRPLYASFPFSCC